MNSGNRVMLIYPDYRSRVFAEVSLPVGLGYVAKALELAGVRYEAVDLNIDSPEDLFRRIAGFQPQFLGISLMSYRCKGHYALLNEIKQRFPNLTIVAGGPHITANRERVMAECPAIDIGVAGEGEAAIVEIVRGDSLTTVKGALYRDGGAVKFAGARDFIDDLDEVPFPTYGGFKLERYGKTMPVNSSRGCPYKCIFCGAPRILGSKWRKRSAHGMLTEVRYWHNKGYRSFYFSDSNFAVDKTRVRDFCEEVIKNKLDVTFTSDGLRADHVSRELLEQMRHAGFTRLVFGVESGSNHVLQNLKKGETREQIEAAIATATGLGFNVALFFLVGCPGEETGDIRQSFELARKYDIDQVFFFNLTPIPQTEFYDWAVGHGFLDSCDVSYPEGNFGFDKRASLPTDVMTVSQVTRWMGRARHVERQIQWRYQLRQVLQGVFRKPVRTNTRFFNTLTWYISYPVVTSLLGGLFRVKVKAGTYLIRLVRRQKP